MNRVYSRFNAFVHGWTPRSKLVESPISAGKRGALESCGVLEIRDKPNQMYGTKLASEAIILLSGQQKRVLHQCVGAIPVLVVRIDS